MVSHEDLADDNEYEDIKEDIRLECTEHGPVNKVFIPRSKDGWAPDLEGVIYVDFKDSRAAQAAALALNGRNFANNVVVVDYYDEMKFDNGVY